MAKKNATKKKNTKTNKKTSKKTRSKKRLSTPDSMGGPGWSFPAGGIFPQRGG